MFTHKINCDNGMIDMHENQLTRTEWHNVIEVCKMFCILCCTSTVVGVSFYVKKLSYYKVIYYIFDILH